MKNEIVLLSRDDHNQWNDYVFNHPRGTVFHTTTWLERIDPGVKVYAGYVKEKLYGGVAILKTKKHGVWGYHRPQYTQYFSPLFGNSEVAKYSLTKEHEFIEDLLKTIPRVGHYEFKFNYGHHTFLSYHWNGFTSEVTSNHIVKLSDHDPMINFSSKKRRELKKLIELKAGGQIEIDSDPDFDEIWNLVAETATRKNYNQDRDIFSRVFNQENRSIFSIGLKYPPHGYISAAIVAFDNKAMYNLINASTRRNIPEIRTATLLVIHELLLESQKRGLEFDCEGSMLRGVEFFLREVGGEQVGVYEVKKSPSIIYSSIRAIQQLRGDRKAIS